jgi:hypothetical protein
MMDANQICRMLAFRKQVDVRVDTVCQVKY